MNAFTFQALAWSAPAFLRWSWDVSTWVAAHWIAGGKSCPSLVCPAPPRCGDCSVSFPPCPALVCPAVHCSTGDGERTTSRTEAHCPPCPVAEAADFSALSIVVIILAFDVGWIVGWSTIVVGRPVEAPSSRSIRDASEEEDDEVVRPRRRALGGGGVLC